MGLKPVTYLKLNGLFKKGVRETLKPLANTGDRERIRTAGLPLRSFQRTTKNIERTGGPGFTFRS